MANEIYAGNPFRVNAVATDPDKFPGTPLTYFWTQVAGPATALFSDIFGLTPTITCPEAGDYSFDLAVSDGISVSHDTLLVSVLPFYTGHVTYTAQCPSGTMGEAVVESAVFTSIISQADADEKALEAAAIAANAALRCTSAPAVWTLRLARELEPHEKLRYNFFLLDGGNAQFPSHATFLHSFSLDEGTYSPGDTLDYSGIVAPLADQERTFLWQVAYSVPALGSGGSGEITVSEALPLAYELLAVDPSYTLMGKSYTRFCTVSDFEDGVPNPITGLPSLASASTFIQAPRIAQTYLALQHNFSPPALSRLWVYNWDGRKDEPAPRYDFLRISRLDSGTLEAPGRETTLFEYNRAIVTYGQNMFDEDANYLSLDEAVASLPSDGGVLIVRRGKYDPVGRVVVYAANSTLLSAQALAGTGSVAVSDLSPKGQVLENIRGALVLDSNRVIARAAIAVGAFGVRFHNWRDKDEPYNYLVVCELIGRPGAFSGVARQTGFQMAAPDSPGGFIEIPLPLDAKGVSFVFFAATEAGPANYILYADSFPLGTELDTHYMDVFDDPSPVCPYTVSSLLGNTIPGLPSANRGVMTIIDDTRQILLERDAPHEH